MRVSCNFFSRNFQKHLIRQTDNDTHNFISNIYIYNKHKLVYLQLFVF